MQFNFQLHVLAPGASRPEEIQTLLVKHLSKVHGVKCTLEPTTHALVTSAATEKLESYAEKIARLTATVALVAHDFDAPNPYGNTLKKSRGNGEISEHELVGLEKFSVHAPLLARIKRFLVAFPATPEYDALRFRQKLLRANLDFPRLYREPEKIPGAILQAFEEYRREYVKTYRTFLRAREESVATFRERVPELTRQIQVIAALDTLPVLGASLAPKIQTRLTALMDEYRPLAWNDEQIDTHLTNEPTLAGLTFFSPTPAPVLHAFEAEVANALTTKLQIISEKSVLAILKSSRDPAIQKLTRLITLAELTKLPRLFSPRTTPKILHALAKLFNENQLMTVALGDFAPRHATLDSVEKIRTTALELEKFLTAKLQSAKNKKLVII